MEKRYIPIKNYFLLFGIFITVILLCIYFSSWYKMSEEAKMKKGIMSELLSQIKIEEVPTFLQENPNTYIYVSSSVDESLKRFEKNLYDYIIDHHLDESFVYVDTNRIDISDLASTLKKISNISDENKDLYYIHPNLYIIKNAKIEKVLYHNKKNLNSKEAISFIEKEELGV